MLPSIYPSYRDVVGDLSKVKRRFLREKEARLMLSEYFAAADVNPNCLPRLKPPIESVGINDEEVFFVDKKPVLVRRNKRLFPFLPALDFQPHMASVVVNMGAVPHVCNGADVMAPGIVGFEGEFNCGDVVLVVDERHRKAIAVAVARCDMKEAAKLKTGKVLSNVHYVGDKLWKMVKRL